jgi:hypothetical protein
MADPRLEAENELAFIAIDEERAALIGHNNPPEPTPYEGFRVHIDDLLTEARNFLDGDEIASEGQAQAVAVLLDQARKAKKDADAARADEKRPHDEAAKAVQTKWKPLIEACDLTEKTAKEALAPWLLKKEAEQREAAEAARREAEEKARLAAEAARAAAANDLTAREDADRLIKDAENAAKFASKAEKAKAHASGGSRAVGLRSYFTATLTDPVEALKHYKQARPDDLKAFLLSLAQTDVQNGARSIPGFTVIEERKAV